MSDGFSDKRHHYQNFQKEINFAAVKVLLPPYNFLGPLNFKMAAVIVFEQAMGLIFDLIK